MKNHSKIKSIILTLALSILLVDCKIPGIVQSEVKLEIPKTYPSGVTDSNTISTMNWRNYFNDPALLTLIDSALQNNQELNLLLQEIQIAKNEIQVRKGEYLPFVNIGGGMGAEKVGRYTSKGAMEASTNITKDRKMPEPMTDIIGVAKAAWEVDIWHKLRDAKDAAIKRYLASNEGRNFMITNLIAEIADAYYELQALSSQLEIVNQNITIQNNALQIIKIQKEAARTTELAVQRFVAEVSFTKSLQFDIRQEIVEVQNRINYLVGRYPKAFTPAAKPFMETMPQIIKAGLPAQLLENRPDIKKAELEIAAAKLDVQVAKKNFYPNLSLSAAVGLDAFNPRFILKAPESILFSLAGDIVGPVINRKAIQAAYYSANAKQLQAAIQYQQTILKAYLEVVNQLAKIENLDKSFALKSERVAALKKSISISDDLYRNARADYMEVLLTQRDALDAQFELVETKLLQMNAVINLYKALGGGWQ